jgi:hypothetical protein
MNTASLAATDPTARAEASLRLLAQAVTDLQVSAYLLRAAQGGQPRHDEWPADWGEDDGFVSLDIEANLAILSSDAIAFATRAIALPPDLPSARSQLAGVVVTTLDAIEGRAARTGQTAVSGLLVLGIGQVAHAAGIVGSDIAQALGVAEQASRIFALARDFALSAYNAVVALLGPAVAQSAAQQVLAWVNDVAAGEQLQTLLARLYGTKQTAQHLDAVVTASQADLGKFVIAIREVEGLNSGFQQQLDLVDKLLRGFRLLGGAAAATIPQATVLMAAAYIVIVGYAVFAGADYVDARTVRVLNRVPGVRQVVERSVG